MTQQIRFSKLTMKLKPSNFMNLVFLAGLLHLTASVLDMKQAEMLQREQEKVLPSASPIIC